jgi:hypothetical protein
MLLINLAEVALLRNENDEARSSLEKALHGGYGKPQDEYETWGEAYLHLSVVDYRQARYEEARSHAVESLHFLHAGKRLVDIPGVLQLIAITRVPFEDWLGVATLLGAAEGLAESYGAVLRETLTEAHSQASASVRATLGPSDYIKAHNFGRAMVMNAAVDFAMHRQEIFRPRMHDGAESSETCS